MERLFGIEERSRAVSLREEGSSLDSSKDRHVNPIPLEPRRTGRVSYNKMHVLRIPSAARSRTPLFTIFAGEEGGRERISLPPPPRGGKSVRWQLAQREHYRGAVVNSERRELRNRLLAVARNENS